MGNSWGIGMPTSGGAGSDSGMGSWRDTCGGEGGTSG